MAFTEWSQSAGGRKKVVLLCWGSRGDVQPVVALALELKKLGMRPTLFVNDQEDMRHPEFVRSFSLEVEPYPEICPFDAKAMMDGDEPCATMDTDTSPEEEMIFAKVKRIRPDLVVFCGRLALIAWALEKLLSICTIEFCFHRDASCMDVARDRMKNATCEARRLSLLLGGKLEPEWEEVVSACGLHRPVLYAVSPEVVSRHPGRTPATATSGVHFTGYWTLDQQQQRGASFGSLTEQDLNRFIAGDPDVVYMGWGSMHVISNEFMVQLAVRTLKLLNRKGIILGSYAQLGQEALYNAVDRMELVAYARRRILWLRWAAHEWLMPRCGVIVHHGGCGTTAAALRSGQPTVVTPTAFDQFYWGDRVKKLGVGVCTGHLSNVTPQELADAVRECQWPAVQKKAAALGQRLRAEEPGAANAAKFLAEYTRNVVVPGLWAQPPQQSTLSTGGAEKPLGTNLALRRPATASSSKSPDKAASMAVDGQSWTRWTSAYADMQWLAVDLGEVQKVSVVVINWEAAYARTYEVQGSVDGEDYEQLALAQGCEGYVSTKLKPSCRVRYLRMWGFTRATQYGFSIWEFNAYA